MTAPTNASVMTAEYVNPVLTATRNVFETMLSCTPVRTGLKLKTVPYQSYEVSAVIGISGKVAGTIVVSISERAALQCLERMVGVQKTAIDDEVCDAVGEITNMIAGAAKAQLEKYNLSLSIPNVVSGSNHVVHYPSSVTPMVITFDSEIGPLTVEVGFAGLE